MMQDRPYSSVVRHVEQRESPNRLRRCENPGIRLSWGGPGNQPSPSPEKQMRTLDLQEIQEIGGGQPALSNVIAVVGLSIAVCTAPAWGAAAALIGLGVLFSKTMED